ncbi:P-loop containing nucleoside triphosphate hydrolase protein [Gonapodya prolifera JEL478]|uniref:Signal recognition particle receptor subunit beta n=1 Tax=Gonapodya prolifera (strain JEL478) TaxID=1344416 RepID=A0A139AMF2_GONPJ|nr:P-loop containing nucleoside triphosphate hydrolase protein [Gonapodya prolifera JEL478]|eukprot:KXS17929.1 P-loop containing nucleoside triphosphate hydrolase protein [Gonapodya prolifera JEL478]
MDANAQAPAAFSPSPLSFFVLLLLLAAIAALALLFLSKSKPKKDAFIIVGLSDSGKSTLFSLLRYGKALPTVTSIEQNEATFPLYGSKEPHAHHIIDLPGHPTLHFLLSDYTPLALGIIFVIDAATFPRLSRSVAERLYDVLAERNVMQGGIRVLVVCNKQDSFVAWPREKIAQALEKEIDYLRTTRTATLDAHTTTASETSDTFLGLDNAPFRMSHLDTDVRFVECALVGQEPGGGEDDAGDGEGDGSGAQGGESVGGGDEEGGRGLERIKRWIEEVAAGER